MTTEEIRTWDKIEINNIANKALISSIIDQHKHDDYCLEAFASKLCAHCLNNPKNGGSGICNCILGNMVVY